MENQSLDDYRTIQEVSHELGVSIRTIFSKIKKGVIQTRKVGRTNYIHINDLDKLRESITSSREGISHSRMMMYDTETEICMSRKEYEGLVFKCGIQEERIRVLQEENRRLLEYQPTPKPLSWWKRLLGKG